MGESARQVILGAIVPFALFYQARERVSLTAAIVVTTVWSVGLILHTWRTRRRFDILTAGSLALTSNNIWSATQTILDQLRAELAALQAKVDKLSR